MSQATTVIIQSQAHDSLYDNSVHSSLNHFENDNEVDSDVSELTPEQSRQFDNTVIDFTYTKDHKTFGLEIITQQWMNVTITVPMSDISSYNKHTHYGIMFFKSPAPDSNSDLRSIENCIEITNTDTDDDISRKLSDAKRSQLLPYNDSIKDIVNIPNIPNDIIIPYEEPQYRNDFSRSDQIEICWRQPDQSGCYRDKNDQPETPSDALFREMRNLEYRYTAKIVKLVMYSGKIYYIVTYEFTNIGYTNTGIIDWHYKLAQNSQ